MKLALANFFEAASPKAPPVVWEEDETWPEDMPEEAPSCDCCGEYLYNGPICPNCRGLI